MDAADGGGGVEGRVGRAEDGGQREEAGDNGIQLLPGEIFADEGRLVREDVRGEAAELPASERREHGGVVEELAPGGVDEYGPVTHGGYAGGVYDVPRLLREGAVEDYRLALPEELRSVHVFDDALELRPGMRGVGQDARAEAEKLLSQAKVQAQKEHDEIVASAQQEIADSAVKAAEKMIAESTSQTFDQFLASVERSKSHDNHH